MNQKKITIIVPVYNGESYVKRCVDMLLNQDYQNFEIIVVNDGSTDKTQEVLEKKYKENSKVRVISTNNQGVSTARNIGINASTGEYLLFVDSDDQLVPNALQRLNEQLIKYNSELLIFGFSVFGDSRRKNDTYVLKKFEKDFRNENKEFIRALLSTNDNILGYAWRAVYSTYFLKVNDIKFEKQLKISEDYLFLLRAMICSRNTVATSQELYEYHIGQTSMSTTHNPTLLHDMMWVNNWIYENIIMNSPDLYPEYQYSVTNTYIRFVQNSLLDHRKIGKQIFDIIKVKHNFNFQKNISFSFNHLDKFDTKSKIGIVMFKFRLEVLYAILFKVKANIGRF